MPDIINPGGSLIAVCPRCGREVRPGLGWAQHYNWHWRQDRATAAGNAAQRVRGDGNFATVSKRGLDRAWGNLPEAW